MIHASTTPTAMATAHVAATHVASTTAHATTGDLRAAGWQLLLLIHALWQPERSAVDLLLIMMTSVAADELEVLALKPEWRLVLHQQYQGAPFLQLHQPG
jgi:hypothetical protein